MRDVLRAHPWLTLSAALAGAAQMVPAAVLPLVVGVAVDRGIADGRGVGGWIAVILALAAAQAAASAAANWTSHTMWVAGAVTAQKTLVRHAAALGATLPKKLRTGDVVAMASDDVESIGNGTEQVGRAAGAVLSFAIVAVVLIAISPLLGIIALVGVPLAASGIGILLTPLRRRKEDLRERFAEVNALGVDIVGGLRVLRGIGGERRFHQRFVAASRDVRKAGVQVGRVQGLLAAAEVVLTGLVLVAVTWVGARLALDGVITAGELITFYGASAFLVVPVGAAGEAAEALSSAWVAARKFDQLLQHRPPSVADPVTLPEGSLSIEDGETFVPAGKLTVLDASHTQAERLAGFHGDALVGGVPVNRVDPSELRRRVVLVLGDDLWFSGPVGAELAAGDRFAVERAVWAADAQDVIDALADGLDEELSERGRSVSGGQRQRLLLARALTLDPDVLVLDEPTSAVDAHTERRIVERLTQLRAGRTTVVLTSSPLWRVR